MNELSEGGRPIEEEEEEASFLSPSPSSFSPPLDVGFSVLYNLCNCSFNFIRFDLYDYWWFYFTFMYFICIVFDQILFFILYFILFYFIFLSSSFILCQMFIYSHSWTQYY